MDRVNKTNYYLDIAQMVAERSTCYRKHYGAIIVKNDSIVSTGYNGAPRGRKNCTDLGSCTRESLGIPRGERYELCRSVHAEANAIIAASRDRMIDSVLYMVGIDPSDGSLVADACSCQMCKRLIINAGISKVVVRNTQDKYTVYSVRDWVYNDDSVGGTLGY